MKYATGRNYGADQILEITHGAIPADQLADVPVDFVDAARGISGTVKLMAFEFEPAYRIGEAVLREYDAGRYTLN